jgi:hypothetical protein
VVDAGQGNCGGSLPARGRGGVQTAVVRCGVGRTEARWREGADVRPRARRGDTDRWVPRDSDFFPI